MFSVGDHARKYRAWFASTLRSGSTSSSEDSSTGGPIVKRRSISASTVEKWKFENDRELNAATWLMYEKARVSSLRCSVCIQFQSKLCGMRNYNPAFNDGSKNLRASSFKDHAVSSMHAREMLLLKRTQSTNIYDYAPIAKALHTIDASVEQQMKRTFDIAFTIAKDYMAYAKMKQLEERHGVN